MEEQLRKYMEVMRNFGNVYTKKIVDGIGKIKLVLSISFRKGRGSMQLLPFFCVYMQRFVSVEIMSLQI
jgi:hypothetical protein